jgi:predicted transposase YbfD/YdcC
MPEEVSGFAASRLALRMRRSVSRKRTGELREETTYALTSLLAPAGELYALWRGHWEVENRLHHKRDTVLGEDASRSRKGALGLMYLRDVVLNLLHLKKQPVLRSVRRFSANPQALLRLIQRL